MNKIKNFIIVLSTLAEEQHNALNGFHTPIKREYIDIAVYEQVETRQIRQDFVGRLKHLVTLDRCRGHGVLVREGVKWSPGGTLEPLSGCTE